MTALKLDKFGGMLPAWDEGLLPDGQAAYSRNAYLYSGTLTGWRKPKFARNLNDALTKFVYRVPNKDTLDTTIGADDCYWLEFEDANTTVMHSPVVQDQYQRYYFGSTTAVPKYNTYQRIADSLPPWYLGVPQSGCTPGVTVEGGGDTMPVGFTTVEDTAEGSTFVSGNYITLVPIVPTGSMIMESISINAGVVADAGNMNMRGVVYSDFNGKPYQLLGQTDATAIDMNQVTQTIPFTNGVSVISNTTYWIGIMSNAAFLVEQANSSVNTYSYPATYTNDAPDTINVGDLTHSATVRLWANLVGASIFEARGYVYTWVTEYDEEGPPSEPVVVNGWSNATWTITLFQPETINLGGPTAVRNIKKTRIYRTVTSQAGIGTYFLVAEIPVEQGVYVDQSEDDKVALNTQLLSLYWFPPPEDLQAIVDFPNGIAVGFRSNEIWFSEAYRPHAWPPGYVLTTEFPIVGVGVAGQSIVVCTKGAPYLVSGVNPASMSITKINLTEPCLHRGSIVATDTAVLYISPNGLIQISQSGAGLNVTENWVSREKWQKYTPHSEIRAIKLATSYFAFGNSLGDHDPLTTGFTLELSSEDKTSFTIWPQAGGHRLGLNLMTPPTEYDIYNVLVDQWTGIGLVIQNQQVFYYDFADPAPEIVPYTWRSRVYQEMAKRNYEAIKVFFTVPTTTPAQVERDVSHPQLTLGDNQYGIVRVYVDGELWTSREIRRSGELLRIFSGIKGEEWQFEIEGRVEISNVQIATSVKELAQV